MGCSELQIDHCVPKLKSYQQAGPCVSFDSSLVPVNNTFSSPFTTCDISCGRPKNCTAFYDMDSYTWSPVELTIVSAFMLCSLSPPDFVAVTSY